MAQKLAVRGCCPLRPLPISYLSSNSHLYIDDESQVLHADGQVVYLKITCSYSWRLFPDYLNLGTLWP